MKNNMSMSHIGHENQVEHHLADQLISQIKNCGHLLQFRAKCKVLAKMVGEHVRDEETRIFPMFKDLTKLTERKELCMDYLELRRRFLSELGGDIH